jgi:hypothetical protein
MLPVIIARSAIDHGEGALVVLGDTQAVEAHGGG